MLSNRPLLIEDSGVSFRVQRPPHGPATNKATSPPDNPRVRLLAKWFRHTHLRDMTTSADTVAFEPSDPQRFARIEAFGTMLDVTIGGDALDVVWRANRRSIAFLRDWFPIEGSPK